MCSTLKTGTKAYMDLYPEGSTDGGLRLGNIVPDFSMETTHGNFPSFHEWKKGKWAILFSHPADFTPVCTTEIGRLVSTLNMIVGLVEIMLIWVDFSSLHQALKYDQLKAMDCLVATLSVDPVKSHTVSLLYHSFVAIAFYSQMLTYWQFPCRHQPGMAERRRGPLRK